MTAKQPRPEREPMRSAGGGTDRAGQKQRAEQRDWEDEAAEARTADDPRARTPHDRTGTPSIGERDRA
ncbi:hypothetical protein [Micromonospora sp. NPDC049679]|uniref:hypothetical protein n=1 Tax=Micromonospora sp. NPDC049679 TaxID=3155920 RepID=UPI0034071B2B